MQPVARRLDAEKMSLLGIRNTMRIAKGYNTLRRGRLQRRRRSIWSESFVDLAAEAGGSPEPRIRLEDGWALDTSGSLPHLEEMLSQADEVIEERGGQADVDDRYRAFFRNLITVDDHERWPGFLDFAGSPELVAIVADYLGFVPALSNTLPIGVRDGRVRQAPGRARPPRAPRQPGLPHRPLRPSDGLRDRARPRHATRAWARSRSCPLRSRSPRRERSGTGRAAAPTGSPTRRSTRWSTASETRRLTYPRGTVLFIDTSRCFHYGARDGERPRFQTMSATRRSAGRTSARATCPSRGSRSGPRRHG